MGSISLHNKDCMEVLKTFEDNSIDLIVTDPPYRVTSRGGSTNSMGGYWIKEKARKGKIFDNNDISCSDYLPEFYRVLKDKTHLYLMCNNVNLQEMINVGTSVGFNFVKCLIWEKDNKICGRYYMNCFEYIILFRKGGDRPINDCGTPDILSVPIKKLRDKDGANLHDTEKPVDLMKILVKNSIYGQDDIVLDPFMGSGSTGVACRELGCNFVGCEIDTTYFEVAQKRLSGVVRKNLF